MRRRHPEAGRWACSSRLRPGPVDDAEVDGGGSEEDQTTQCRYSTIRSFIGVPSTLTVIEHGCKARQAGNKRSIVMASSCWEISPVRSSNNSPSGAMKAVVGIPYRP